jgi:hypothetical protein
MIDIFNRETLRQPWGGLDWNRDSFAVVVCDGNGNGAVLWTVGPHVKFEIQECGLKQLSDLGLDDAPLGISVWVGKYIWQPGPWEWPEDGSMEAVGKFRAPTDEEWMAIRDRRCPWDEEEWRAKDPAPK